MTRREHVDGRLREPGKGDDGPKKSRMVLIAAALPGVVMLGLFYSLAFHMYRSLGAWPTSIGEEGFSAALVIHGKIAINVFIAVVLIGMFVLPVAILVCLLVPRWRGCVPYFAFYGFTILVCFGLMQLAPAPFLNWWWD